MGHTRLVSFLATFSLMAMIGCNDDLLSNCDDCPITSLQPACLEASADCEQFSGDTQQECLAEALALCSSQPTAEAR